MLIAKLWICQSAGYHHWPACWCVDITTVYLESINQ